MGGYLVPVVALDLAFGDKDRVDVILKELNDLIARAREHHVTRY